MISLIIFSYPNDGRKLKRLIQGLVQGKFVACVQVINYVHSYYIREEKFTKSQEKLVVCKTDPLKRSQAVSFIQKQHPYSIPEILTQDVDSNEAYEEWVKTVIGRGK
ncbi:MAG TPA: divalent cation tolerance protein CutA [Candidatus Absconditabacterales bacterium]|nr:divalent cation tolerance protein CutA [Candidatus Absconditabacterales bacterium]HNG97552.1 divalent cation tolerance protein CutA [Candidatus Absconditabacterales bacterium]